MQNKKLVRVALFGAAPDTPNMGVSALFKSVVTTLSQYISPVEIVVFDNGLGRRDATTFDYAGNKIPMIRYGARGGYRYYRPENLHTMLLLSKLGRFGALMNEGLRLIDSCDVVFDISGGDSFSDIYGLKRFHSVNMPKTIAVNRVKPLFLLPQTYGPYKHESVKEQAVRSISSATMAWARDEDSYEILKSVLGSNFDSTKHLCGVDVAFLLKPVDAADLLSSALNEWIKNKEPEYPLIGVNVSGLIYNDPEGARGKYGFKSDYKKILVDFVSKLIDTTSARIILIPHVMDKGGHYESDIDACFDLLKHLPVKYEERILVSPATLNESQVKWLISKMDWFCGTRMHSTIASLSSCVPTTAISYSDKTKGVFETCKQGSFVYDPRELMEDEIVKGLLHSFSVHKSTKLSLPGNISEVVAVAHAQMKKIIATAIL